MTGLLNGAMKKNRTGNGVKFGLTSSSWDCRSLPARFLFIHSYINKQAMGYILVDSLTRLKTWVYKINGAEYIKVYIKHNGELNPGIIPMHKQNYTTNQWYKYWGPSMEHIYSAQVLARRWNCSPTARVLLFPTFMLLHRLKTITLYKSIVLLHSWEEKNSIFSSYSQWRFISLKI